MRALTLKPHWAHAVAHLGKRCENRSRPIPRALVGERVAIHAGATLPREWMNDLCRAGSWAWLTALGGRPATRLELTDTWQPVATRAIVATAVLGRCRESVRGLRAPPAWSDPEAAWWWRLDDVRTLAVPVPFQRGQLGLWTLPEAVALEVTRAES